MAKLKLKASYPISKGKLETRLSLISFEEDGVTIIYSPALDLSGSGYDLNQAKASFWEALNEFFRYTVNKNTLAVELKRLGWDIKGTKLNRKVSSPDFTTLLKQNEEFRDIVSNKEFSKFNETVQIPVFA
ncbi:MAG: hypothetical protein IPP77_04075 [Bacteroidetes bacterium]|nr:hypothetical protein [Bacteroidota bacterium]